MSRYLQPGLPGMLGSTTKPFSEVMAGTMPLPNDMARAGQDGVTEIDVLQAYFGAPMNNPVPKNFSSVRDVNIQDNDQAYMHQYLDYSTQRLTYEVVTAIGAPLLNKVTKTVIDYVQKIHATQTSYNIIPAQPISVMGQAKYNSRNSLEYILRGRRVAAAALERMEILMTPDFGKQAADFMIRSTATSIIFEKEHDVLGTLTQGYFIRWFLETDGQRDQQFDNYERQLINEMEHFGAFNKSVSDAQAAIGKAKNYVEAANHIIFLPYNMKNEFRKMPTYAEPQKQLASLEITDRGARMLGMLIHREQAFSAASTEEQATVLASDATTQIYLAPPSSLEPGYTDVGYGALNSIVQFAGYHYSGSLTPQGESRRFYGDIVAYDGQRDQPMKISAAAAMLQSGWWNLNDTKNGAGSFPNFSPTNGAFSEHAHNYVRKMQGVAGPGDYEQFNSGDKVAQYGELTITDQDKVRSASQMHAFLTFGRLSEANADTGRYEIANTIGAMYPVAMPHNLTLRAGAQLCERVEEATRNHDLAYTAKLAFNDLDIAIRTIIDHTEPSPAWAQAVLTVNSTTVKNPVDGCTEVKQNPNGSLNLPEYRGDLEKSYLYGCTSGPMLKAIAGLNLQTMAAAPRWVFTVHALLNKCLPIVETSLNLIRNVLPQTLLLNHNLAPAWYRQQKNSVDLLTMLIANEYGDIPLFLNSNSERFQFIGSTDMQTTTKKKAELKPGEVPPATEKSENFVESLFFGDKLWLHANVSDEQANKALEEVNKTLGGDSAQFLAAAKHLQTVDNEMFKVDKFQKRAYMYAFLNLCSHTLSDPKLPPAVETKILKGWSSGQHILKIAALNILNLQVLEGKTTSGTTREDFNEKPLSEWAKNYEGKEYPHKFKPGADAAARSNALVRTPLVFAGANVARDYHRRGTNCLPGAYETHYQSPFQDGTHKVEYLVDGTVSYVDSVKIRNVVDANNNVLQPYYNAQTSSFKPPAPAARAAHFGAPLPATGKISGQMMSSPTLQNFQSVIQLRWHQWRMQAYDMQHGSGDLFGRVCWRAYLETPLTYFSVARFFRKNEAMGIQPPVDVRFMKLSQTFWAGDLCCTTDNAVEMRMQPAAAYLAQDLTHKLVSLQADLRSLTWMPNPKQSMVLHAVYVEPNMAGRSNGLIRPGTSKQVTDWCSRNNSENTLVVLEKVTLPWLGVMSINNQFSPYVDRSMDKLGTMYKSLWSSMVFCAKEAFAEYFASGGKSIEKVSNAANAMRNAFSRGVNDVLQNPLPTLKHATKSKQTLATMSRYIFRQWCQEQDDEGQFTVELVGDSVFPLGQKWWNDTQLRITLSRGMIEDKPQAMRVTKYA